MTADGKYALQIKGDTRKVGGGENRFHGAYNTFRMDMV